MSISDLFERNSFVLTAEITPPKGVDFGSTLSKAFEMSKFVDAINVTDGQSAMMRMGSLSFSHLLLDKGIEPVFQMTCRDRNRIALQSDLLNAAALGIKNVLCLTGDHIALGDHPGAKQVFDLDSVSLLSAVKGLNEGRDLVGNALRGATDFVPGAVVNPNSVPWEPQLLKMKRKLEAGARFIQTQAVFDIAKLSPFVELGASKRTPVLMGVLFLKSHAQACHFNEKVSGIVIPDAIISELQTSKNPEDASVEIASRLVKRALEVCQGVHLMNVTNADILGRIVEMAGIGK